MTRPAPPVVHGDRETLPLPGGDTVVEWRRSKRARRVSLRIDAAQGAVIVTLPIRASRRAGLALLMGNTDWVAARLAALPAPTTLADGATLPIEGIPYRIRHCPGERFAARLNGQHLEVSGDVSFLPRRVTDFLRSEARRRLSVRVQSVTARAGLAARRVTVKDTSSRWGSCSADRALSFSWRLLMAPDFVLDYVVAHEIAHLKEMNHSPRFWAHVRALVPDIDAPQDWLKRHGRELQRYGFKT